MKLDLKRVGYFFEKGKLPVEMLQALSLRPEILKAFGMMGKGVYPGGLIERI